MLKKFRLRNAWVHKDTTIDFENGHTTITGRNGKGKSLILEMIQYAFWGSKALRGEAPDYKGVTVELWFTLKGEDYYVIRSAKLVQLSQVLNGGNLVNVIASGTTGVNSAIRGLFGYSFDVFKVANVANQGTISALSGMLPTARKRLVDDTIGLSVIESLEGFISQAIKDTNASLLAARDNHVEPTAPVFDTTAGPFLPEVEVNQKLVELRATLNTLNILKASAAREVKSPTAPYQARDTYDIEDLRQKQQAYVLAESKRNEAAHSLKALPPAMEPVVLTASDDEYEPLKKETHDYTQTKTALEQVTRFIGNTPRSSPYNLDNQEADQAIITLAERWDEKSRLVASLHLNHCPNCNHEWHTPDPRLSAYEDVPEERPTPSYTKKALADMVKMAQEVASKSEQFQERDRLAEKFSTLMDHTLKLTEIEKAREAYAKWQNSLQWEEHRTRLRAEAQAELPPFYGEDIRKAEALAKAWVQFESDLVASLALGREVEVAMEAVKRFPTDLEEQISTMERLLRNVVVFVNAFQRFSADKSQYDLQGAKILELENELDQWKAARGAMLDVRSAVKGYLLPSLNKVASSLLSQMTGGELTDLRVDEDFEMWVGAQKVNTLSGAGKDVANLALRMGLGTVLTNQTFSVLMLDEPDAGYDDVRAEYTAQCLNNLTKVFKQLIVVTHKHNTTTDRRIEL